MLNVHATAPMQLPQHISPVNHPYILHIRFFRSSDTHHHRKNMVPLAAALTQKAPICVAASERTELAAGSVFTSNRSSVRSSAAKVIAQTSTMGHSGRATARSP